MGSRGRTDRSRKSEFAHMPRKAILDEPRERLVDMFMVVEGPTTSDSSSVSDQSTCVPRDACQQLDFVQKPVSYSCNGREKENVLPESGLFAAHNRPRCASMIDRQIARPNPRPSGLVV